MPLQTSGKDLKKLLEKSGARHKTEGAEQLDFLVWLAEQVKGSIEDHRRMNLTVHDLAELLRRESMDTSGTDAKSCVTGLLALRRREIDRLNYGSKVANNDQCFELALAEMTGQQVSDCFALVLHESGTVERGGDDVDKSLPGQVVSPRSQQRQGEPAAAAEGGKGVAASSTLRSSAGNTDPVDGGRSSVDASFLLPPPPPSVRPPAKPGSEPKVPKIEKSQQQKRRCAVM
eukprot:TRINITY_DN19140_c0_g1_i1.p1 TRINITY_DN19140_c0_g1~~TRINITY_DN19140_c0_g1_i1.p1  ORF type:complete len:231 (+),score=45.10 TRINITY_DN19140_c0_g1_i1:184-876(+)